MIWWLWTAYDPVEVHLFDVEDAWLHGESNGVYDPDVFWLGEGAWTCRRDNMGVGLR